MPTAFILTRYSTDNQNPDTTAVQVKKCAEYCRQHQLTVLDIFSDEAVSGMKQHRPEYDRMMAAYQAKAGADVVVIYDQSRMFRDMVEWFNFRRQLQALGARVISVTQPLVGGDLLDPSVFVSESTMAMFNHLHVLITRQKVIEKMRYMALQGKCPGGRPPLGYDLDADRHYIINEFEADTVRRIFTMHAAGAGYGEIITAMAAQGRLTKAGRPFGKNSLHEVLKNEKYIGVLEYGAVPSVSPTGRRNNHQPPAEGCVRLEGAVPRIISDELWAEVQKRMKERTHLGGRYSAKAEYLLSGKVFCGECGGAMVVAGTSSGARGQRYRYYSCVHKRQTKTCSAKGISVPKLEQLVAEAVKRQLASPEGLRDVISAAAQYRDALTQAAAPRTDELTRQIQEVTKKIRNLVDTLASGISSKAITDQLAELEDEKARLEAAERNIKAATREVGLTDAEIAEGLTKLSMTDESTQDGRRVLLSIVARVVVFADHVDVYTILGPDGKKPDLDTAAKDFITTMGETSLAPKAPQAVKRLRRFFISVPPGSCLSFFIPAILTNARKCFTFEAVQRTDHFHQQMGGLFVNDSYFDGGLLQLIGWRLLGILITVCTCGICYPWAVCMVYGWETRHTVVNGHRLAFDGSAIQLFGNWIKWFLLTIITFGIYGFWLGIALRKWKVKHTYFAD